MNRTVATAATARLTSCRQRLYVGVDEAGRGPLAGPLAVAGVILDPHAAPLAGLNDSKKLSAPRRQDLYQQITAQAVAWRVVMIDTATIDRVNIFQATLRGMAAIVDALCPPALAARIDGKHLPPKLPCPAEAIIGGDRRDPAIMAASILAKVERDEIMDTLHLSYPHYLFDQHKGYPTQAHLDALKRYGPCPAHRQSYAPVQRSLAAQPRSTPPLL